MTKERKKVKESDKEEKEDSGEEIQFERNKSIKRITNLQ